MDLEEGNEITVKIKGELNDFYKILEEKNFKIIDEFFLDDTYFVPETLPLDETSTRKILSKAILTRDFTDKIVNENSKLITFKKKKFDKNGNILQQSAINCKVFDIEDAKKLLNAIGYIEILNIKEDGVVYKNEEIQFDVKCVRGGGNLIEIEIEKNPQLGSIRKIIEKLKEIGIPIYEDNYFVKKAEIELDKKMGRCI